MTSRLGDCQLTDLRATLTDRDRAILETLRKLRCVRTNQIQRLFFLDSSTPRACLTATMKALNRLKTYGLINHLPREVGGVRSGSKGIIWYLAEPGIRLLNLGSDVTARTRFVQPSPSYMRHTIAVSECYVQITEICRTGRAMRLKRIELEPECWRGYTMNGKNQSLRPDLYAETASGRFEDSWFIEMDLATESVHDIIEKCNRYYFYYGTQKEQHATGVFPVVLWIVPSDARKEAITDALKRTFHSRHNPIHLIITPNQLWSVLTDGARQEDLI